MRTAPCITLLILALPLAGLADSAKLIDKSGNWESFFYAEKGGKVCYVASQPKKSSGAPKTRRNVFFTVTHRTTDKSVGVISVSQAIAYKKDSSPQLEIAGNRFELYVSGTSAWARNDKAVVAALLKAKSVAVRGIPAKGDPVVDSYSLDGFVKAYGEIGKACGIR